DYRPGHRLFRRGMGSILQYNGISIGHSIRNCGWTGWHIDQEAYSPYVPSLITDLIIGLSIGWIVCLPISNRCRTQQNGIMVSVTINGWNRLEAPERVDALIGNNPDTAHSREVVFRKCG